MASVRFARGILRHYSAMRSLGSSSSSRSLIPLPLNLVGARSSLSTTTNASADDQSLRRRRRKGGRASAAATSDEQNNTTSGRRFIPDDPSTATSASSSAAFAPTDSHGNLLNSQEYLSLASMSPWVPCPDMVIKRVFEIAEATSKDSHADLGCGDGRLNFAAVGGPYNVSKSWGVDVDSNILDKCRERLGRRFVPSVGMGGIQSKNNAAGMTSEVDKLEFLQADLVQVIERQKEKYQLEKSSDGSSVEADDVDDNTDIQHARDWSEEDDITQKLSQSTVVTMYFVHDALQQLQPYLASTLGGKEGVRVVTVGYEMKGWDATWVERVLGLTIFKYDMKNVSSDPLDWQVQVVGGGDNYNNDDDGTVDNTVRANDSSNTNASKKNASSTAAAVPETFDLSFGGNFDTMDESESSPLGKYLQQKRKQDFEELDAKLEIHHDEALDDFAQSRLSKQQKSPNNNNGNGNNSLFEFEAGEEWDWDFDETEDPEELMMEARKIMAEARAGGPGRGRGMMAGLGDDTADNKKKKIQQDGMGKKMDITAKKNMKKLAKSESDTKPKPVWKMP